MADELARLNADLADAGPEARRRASQVIRKTGQDVVTDAQILVHRITGNLANSIGVDYTPDGLGFEAGPTAHYGAYEEYGTRHRPPHPYMVPAFDRRAPGAVQALAQLGVDAIRS